jgi:RNA polymerase sigma-70 factor, ECF subfamily
VSEIADAGKTGSYDIHKLLSGDHAAFEQLVREETPRLLRMLIRIVRNEEEAKSIVQETFLIAYQRLHTFRSESKFTTWLYSIGIYQARMSLRRKKYQMRLQETNLDLLEPQHQWRYHAWSPESFAESEERARLIRDSIEKLPENYREVITLRDMEELSSEEVSDRVGISSGAVRVRLHRARQALRVLLDPYFD